MDSLSPERVKEYSKILSLLSPKPYLGTKKSKNLFELEFAEVENIKRDIKTSKGILKAMSVFFDCDEKLLVDYRIIQFYHAFNHLLSQIEHLENIERANLHSKPKQDMIEAGVKNLDRFGALNVLDSLAMDYGKSPTEIEKWSYGLVYSLLWKRKVQSDIDENYREAQKK